MRYLITGIGTGVGKTFVSAVLTEALQADYWKPIQCGIDTKGTDKEIVSGLISNNKSVCFQESYLFKEPASPHLAAEKESEKIRLEKCLLPETQNRMIIEGAGGIMVPLNDSNYVIDLAKEFEAEIILVCRNYLGCINHSILSIDYLLRNEFEIKGLVLNGNFDKAVKSSIVNYAELPVLAEIPEINEVTKETVLAQINKVNIGLFD